MLDNYEQHLKLKDVICGNSRKCEIQCVLIVANFCVFIISRAFIPISRCLNMKPREKNAITDLPLEKRVAVNDACPKALNTLPKAFCVSRMLEI